MKLSSELNENQAESQASFFPPPVSLLFFMGGNQREPRASFTYTPILFSSFSQPRQRNLRIR